MKNKMDHTIDQLDDCVYDYLVSKINDPKSLVEIYNDITQNQGHRCTKLNDPKMRGIYKKKFVATCYTLNIHYENIYKIYKNNKLYLIFSRENPVEIYKKHISDSSDFKEMENIFEPTDQLAMIDLFMDDLKNRNYKFEDLLLEDENTVFHILAKYDKTDQFREISKFFDCNLDIKNTLGKTPIDIAIENNNCKILTQFLNYKYEKQILNLNTRLTEIQRMNSKLLEEKNNLERGNIKKNQMGNNMKHYLLHIICVIIVLYVLI